MAAPRTRTDVGWSWDSTLENLAMTASYAEEFYRRWCQQVRRDDLSRLDALFFGAEHSPYREQQGV
jgi:hypothetical protein